MAPNPIFSKNCVLSSEIDYYCLVCSEQFAAEDDTLAHLLSLQHKRNLNSCGYMEKYKDEQIRKINGVYFCEICVLTFPTATKVDLHLQDNSHNSSFEQHIKRVRNEIIAFDKYVISENAWNGLIDDTCILCNTEFDDNASHKASRSHILNLIKSDIMTVEHMQSVYRKIDAKSIQCLTCNIIICGTNPSNHFRNRNHEQLLISCKQYNITSENGNENNFPNNDSKSKLSESVDRYQSSKVNIDLINETAVCKRCSENIDFSTDAIEKHIEEHKKSSNKKSRENVVPLPSGNKTNGTDGKTLYTTPVSLASGKKSGSNSIASGKKSGSNPIASGKKSVPKQIPSAKKVEEFAAKHGLSHNRADNSFYCKICTRRVSATLENLEKHVASSTHKDNKEQVTTTVNKIETKAPVKEPLFESIKTYEVVDYTGEIINIIDQKYWVNAFGFYLIAKYKGKIICHGCNIDLREDNVLDHMVTDSHVEMVTKCLWITSLEDEFIREIRLDVYHCGYCNILEHNWDDLLEHIEMEEHKKKKSEALQNLRNHLPNPFRIVTRTDVQRMLSVFYSHAGRGR